MNRAVRAAALCAAAAVVLTACRFDGVEALPLPGTVRGSGTYVITVELPDAGRLRPNAEAKVDDVAVGTVTALQARDWHAVVTVRLREEVRLPSDATATVGQNSLLGSAYLELARPAADTARAALADGDTVPLERGRAYPGAEQVLAATSVVLNGGGLNQLETITRELDRALADGAVGDLLPQLDSFVGALDAQRDDIVRAVDTLGSLSGRLADQRDVIARAVDRLDPALDVLNAERDDLVEAMAAIRDLSTTGTATVRASREDLLANLRGLQPTLRAVADSGRSVSDALRLAVTFPFPAQNVARTCPGDYCNMFLDLDLTLQQLDANLLSGTPLQGVPGGVESLLGEVPGPAGDLTDPLRDRSDAPLLPPPSGTGPPAEGDPEPADPVLPALPLDLLGGGW